MEDLRRKHSIKGKKLFIGVDSHLIDHQAPNMTKYNYKMGANNLRLFSLKCNCGKVCLDLVLILSQRKETKKYAN